jgi:hypothetical protein
MPAELLIADGNFPDDDFRLRGLITAAKPTYRS